MDPKLILWIVSLCGISLQATATITIKENGYEDIVVAIHKDVPQNNEIISQIQDMFHRASNILYESLDKRVFFRKVTILVPVTWTKDPSWRTDDRLIFKDADVRVDLPHPQYSDDPYVFQPGQCREQGRYIHFTPTFLLNENGFRDSNYGDAGRVLLHEFAHFRYGVFDEYGFRGSRHHPLWYLERRNARPTGCARGVEGSVAGSCTSRKIDGAPTDDCIFIPNLVSNKIRTSLMAYHYLQDVTKFCKTEAYKQEQHNFWAPNHHNKMCNKAGTYDVIMKHTDFRLGNPPKEDLDVTPTFEVAQVQKVMTEGGQEKCGRRTVLVLDLSGSMLSYERYFKLGQAGDRLIRDILPTGTEFGIVVFTGTSSIWAQMTEITDDTVRSSLADNLPERSDFGGGTSISSGLATALTLLQIGGNETKDANIVLITDGATSEDLLALSLPSLIAAEVKVHSIGLGISAEGTIGDLSVHTGGSFSYYSEAGTSTDLDSAMERLLEYVSTCENVGGVEIERLGILIDSTNSPLTGTINVDDSVGKNTLFSFAIPQGVSVEVTVRDPDNKVYNSSSTEYSYTRALNIIRFRFSFAKDGAWVYTIRTSVSTPKLVILVAKSSVLPGVASPIEAETKLNTAGLNLSDSRAPVVYTYVHRGYEPLIRANVTVTVDRTPDPPVTLWLKDDGILPDNREDDGVYTAYFTQFTGHQRISMQARVQNIPGQTAILVAGGSGSSGAPTIFQNRTVEPELELAGNFTRTTSPGALDVSGFTPGADLFPPGAVSDLEVVTFSKGAFTVTLTWTSPGDDYNDGTADRYELRVAGEFENLRDNFNTSLLITDTDLRQGNFTPLLAGSPHTVVVSVPSDWPHDSYIFGLMAFDEVNKTSDLSNFITVTFKEVIVPEGPDIVDTSTTDPAELPLLPIIAGAAGGGVVIIIIITIIAVIACRSHSKPKKMSA